MAKLLLHLCTGKPQMISEGDIHAGFHATLHPILVIPITHIVDRPLSLVNMTR